MVRLRSMRRAALARGLVASLAFAATPVVLEGRAHAHNGAVHAQMTDWAYELMLLAEKSASGGPVQADAKALLQAVKKSPAGAALVAAMAASAPKLRALPSGLPEPQQSVCADPAVVTKLGTSSPNWNNGGVFETMKLGSVTFPISNGYLSSADCGIAPDWHPGGLFDLVNTGTFSSQDHTGVTLGMWSIQPDNTTDDIHMWTVGANAGNLSYVKAYIEQVLGGAAATVWVPLKCAWECTKSIFTFGMSGSCKKCVDDAIAGAKNGAQEVVTEINGVSPSFGDESAEIFTGMSHHIDVVKNKGGGVWSAPVSIPDDNPGMLTDRAGPYGVPDTIEAVAMAFSDQVGATVRYDKSLAPKHYEILTGADGHQPSVHRGPNDWQFLTWPHTPFTPVDNLGMFGWQQFEGYVKKGDFQSSTPTDPSTPPDAWRAVQRLGWALHAIGDATVPMHVTGTFGWGHRPYEDAQENLLAKILGTSDAAISRIVAETILSKAVLFRQLVLDWRANHPELKSKDVPLRDLVTAVAQATWSVTQSKAMWVFNPLVSTTYATGVKETSTGFYESNGIVSDPVPLYRDLMTNGIAAELVLLTSGMEVLP